MKYKDFLECLFKIPLEAGSDAAISLYETSRPRLPESEQDLAYSHTIGFIAARNQSVPLEFAKRVFDFPKTEETIIVEVISHLARSDAGEVLSDQLIELLAEMQDATRSKFQAKAAKLLLSQLSSELLLLARRRGNRRRVEEIIYDLTELSDVVTPINQNLVNALAILSVDRKFMRKHSNFIERVIRLSLASSQPSSLDVDQLISKLKSISTV